MSVWIAYVVFYCVFFFVKQKTAYEMRISDWSSDVCSSDLLRFARILRVLLVATTFLGALLMISYNVDDLGLAESIKATTATVTTIVPAEIGRASCRERVGQYV